MVSYKDIKAFLANNNRSKTKWIACKEEDGTVDAVYDGNREHRPLCIDVLSKDDVEFIVFCYQYMDEILAVIDRAVEFGKKGDGAAKEMEQKNAELQARIKSLDMTITSRGVLCQQLMQAYQSGDMLEIARVEKIVKDTLS